MKPSSSSSTDTPATFLGMRKLPHTAAEDLLGLWLGNRERALQVLLFTTLPMAFLAGFSWPVEALPLPLQWLRWLLPSTAGVQASLRLNQLGAPLADVLPHLGVLLALFGASMVGVLWKAALPRPIDTRA